MLSKKKQDERDCMQKGMVSQSVLGDLNILNSYSGRVTSKPSPQHPAHISHQPEAARCQKFMRFRS
eukprot:scaffold3856_cov127-Skeletonema_dohrnii-CCMP3373.AAC.2